MRPVFNRLAPRLILALTIIVAVVAGVAAYFCISEHGRQLVDQTIRGADQLSRSITSATWHAMRADRRRDVYEVMESIAEEHSVESIRLVNKEGRVTFSTDPQEPAEVGKEEQSCTVCHAHAQPLVELDAAARTRIYRGADGNRKLGMVSAIYNEPSCSAAACHAHSPEARMLGVVDVTLDLEHMDAEMAELQWRRIVLTGTEIVLIAVAIALLTTRLVSRPIDKLREGARAIAAFDLDRPVEVHAPTELSDLAASFDKMRVRLKEALLEIQDFTHGLEEKVAQRTKQLRATQDRLVRSDRLASLGRLAASVAHEINNPIGAVLNLSMVMQRIMEEGGIPPGREEEFRGYLAQISEQTTRVGRIVSDLLAFSRQSTPRHEHQDLSEIVEKTIPLVAHKLELGKVEVDLRLTRGLPLVSCDRSQVQQIVLNLIMNAAEAMPDGGTIYVRVWHDVENDSVALDVEDTGAGIPEEHLARIFDPFFSTKEEGAGVGLGLAVVFGLVEAHNGSLDVQSHVGTGSVFTVRLPLEPQALEGKRA